MGRALRHRDYRIYVTADWFSNTGNWAFRVGLGWLAWELTHSGFWLGLVAAASALPAITMTPFVGIVGDRYDRLVVMKVTTLLSALFALVLAIITLIDLVDQFSLIIFAFLIGLMHTLGQPARLTMTPVLVPHEDLQPAIGLNAALHSSGRFLGPALAGFAIAIGGANLIFFFNVATYFIFLGGLIMIRLHTHEVGHRGDHGVVGDIIHGIKYAFGHAQIGVVIILSIVSAVFTRGFMELFPGFNDVLFGKGPEELGILFGSVGVGGIIGSICFANFGKFDGLFNLGMFILFSSIVFLLVYSTTSFYWLAVAMVVCIGFATAVWQAATNVLIQRTVDSGLRARVMSVYAFSYRAGPALGGLLAGSASVFVGLRAPVIAGAIICLLVLLYYLPRRQRMTSEFDELMAAPSNHPPAAPDPAQ